MALENFTHVNRNLITPPGCRKPVQTATVMVSLKKARTMNSNAQRAVAVVSYLMTTTARKK